MNFNFSELKPNEIYHLMTQTIVPRPVAWILTQNEDEQYNLAPFSYFMPVASDPAAVMVSIGKKPGSEFNGERKDTAVNLQRNPRCTLHIASTEHADDMTKSAATLPNHQSELDDMELDLVPFNNGGLPRIASCKVALDCELIEVQEFGSVPQAIVVLKVNDLYVDESILSMDSKERPRVNAMKLDPIARLGGGEYGRLAETYTIQRPK